MKLNYIQRITLLALFFFNFVCFAQAPTIQQQKALGGSGSDFGYIINKTIDGGYVAVGTSESNDGDVSGNHGNFDFWVVKLTSTGVLEWQKSLGGTGSDSAASIIQTIDGGYIVAGSSSSSDGDVTVNNGSIDLWIVKLTSSGIIQWQKSLGGTGSDSAASIIQTIDGGYIVAGSSSSNDGDVIGNHGSNDYWIVKLTSTGVLEWQKSLGGSSSDSVGSIIQTIDGGYIVVGNSTLNDGDVTVNHGSNDYWVVKLTSTGIMQQQKSLGGSNYDSAGSIIQTIDGGYIVAGSTSSINGDVIVNNGSHDYWIVKLTSTGVIEWQKSYGGTNHENLRSINKTNDGGFILSGNSNSNNGDVTGNHGYTDYWITKISNLGILQWQKSLGGSNDDLAGNIIQINDGSFILSGFSYSNDGDVTGNHNNFGSSDDLWIVKLNVETLSNNTFTDNSSLSIYPNPTKENITLKLNYFSPTQEIIIKDILGKTIHNQKLEGLRTTINTSNLASGIYFLNLSEGSNKIVKKFIKE